MSGHAYVYGVNNPIVVIDPSGKVDWTKVDWARVNWGRVGSGLARTGLGALGGAGVAFVGANVAYEGTLEVVGGLQNIDSALAESVGESERESLTTAVSPLRWGLREGAKSLDYDESVGDMAMFIVSASAGIAGSYGYNFGRALAGNPDYGMSLARGVLP